ncbi:MAG: hypothetical protein LUE29_09705 [Lachnospiraceae bacterium]|nr:hypothetical protein [Lachnospiraceae bacterium]
MGRKKSEIAKRKRYSLRLNGGEQAMLEEVANETGMTMAEILRCGVRLQYRELLKHRDNF